jgi:hypothetical protein
MNEFLKEIKPADPPNSLNEIFSSTLVPINAKLNIANFPQPI